MSDSSQGSGTPAQAPAVVATLDAEGLRTEVALPGHTLIADEPPEAGGTDAGPDPFGYLFTALASCMLITARLYADRKGWPLAGAELRVYPTREKYLLTHARVEVRFEGDLDDAQRQRLLEIVDHCPVHRTLERGVSFETVAM